MRKIILSILTLALISACGSDDPTGPPTPTEITVTISPVRTIIDLSETEQFTAIVDGTNNQQVSWRVNDVIDGDDTVGIITQSGEYTAPAEEPDMDSIKVTAVLLEDLSKVGTAWVHLTDPTKIYVELTGSDSTGTGSRNNPFRTVTHAVNVKINETILVGPGDFNMAGGEEFPIYIYSGTIITGSGIDTTRIIGPGFSNDELGSVFSCDGAAITLERMTIMTTESRGLGVHLVPGNFLVNMKNLKIGPNHTGFIIDNPNPTRPIIETSIITGDSIGIITRGGCEPIIRNCQITDCGVYGIYIQDSSSPDLGSILPNDSTDAGGNTIIDCGPGNMYLIYNDSPDSVWALGNSWVNPNPVNNDIYIWDDDESFGASGPVILEREIP